MLHQSQGKGVILGYQNENVKYSNHHTKLFVWYPSLWKFFIAFLNLDNFFFIMICALSEVKMQLGV